MAPAIEAILWGVFTTSQAVLDQEVRDTTRSEPNVEHDWLVSYFPLKAEDGTTIAVSAMVQDITERKRAEKTIRQANRA